MTGIEEKVKVRATRQARLTEENPPQVWIVLNEAVIRRDFKAPCPWPDRPCRPPSLERCMPESR